MAGTIDQNQWIQADLGKTHRIESVTTQGRPGTSLSHWVISYNISHSQDGINFVKLPTLYDGNNDRDTKMTNTLPANTQARFIRLRPHEWNDNIAMRFDVVGCALPSE